MKSKYIPPIFNYICLYLLCVALTIKNESFIFITAVLFVISLICCYAETLFVILPHLVKSKKVSGLQKQRWVVEGILFDAMFIVSYVSEYIYKEKKDTLITNTSTAVCVIGMIWLFFLLKDLVIV